MTLTWYFDYVSPYPYLQLLQHPELFERSEVEVRPVLFAGLLNHWGQKGPAEIVGKRIHTFRLITWQSAKRGTPLRCPPAHPFNPLHALRLTIALGSRLEVVRAIYDFIWGEGRSVGDEWPALLERLSIEPARAAELMAADNVKAALRENGERAIAAGVFGVPTFVAGKELFWGEDATDMLLDYLADPMLFEQPELKRIDSIGVAASRI
jgi:2-hydroxychromene-2-carboxylate isomerase